MVEMYGKDDRCVLNSLLLVPGSDDLKTCTNVPFLLLDKIAHLLLSCFPFTFFKRSQAAVRMHWCYLDLGCLPFSKPSAMPPQMLEPHPPCSHLKFAIC